MIPGNIKMPLTINHNFHQSQAIILHSVPAPSSCILSPGASPCITLISFTKDAVLARCYKLIPDDITKDEPQITAIVYQSQAIIQHSVPLPHVFC